MQKGSYLMQPICNFDQLLQCAKERSSKGIAVTVPYDKNTLLAVKDALESGLVTAQLFGDQSRILPIMEQIDLSASAVSICHVEETHQAIETAIASIREGKNQILMKGHRLHWHPAQARIGQGQRTEHRPPGQSPDRSADPRL